LPIPFEEAFPQIQMHGNESSESDGRIDGAVPDGVFWLPGCSEVWPVHNATQLDLNGKVDVDHLERSQRNELKRLVHNLYNTLYTLRVKLSRLDCYGLGPTADLIGHELLTLIDSNNENSSSLSFWTVSEEERATMSEIPTKSASLILIDRTLDLVPLCCQGLDNIMDTLWYLSSSSSSCSFYFDSYWTLLPTPPPPLPPLGSSLPSVWMCSSNTNSLFSAMIYKRSKEVIQEVRKFLNEVLMEATGNTLPLTTSLSMLCTIFSDLTTSHPLIVYKYAASWQLVASILYILEKRETDMSIVRFQQFVRLLLRRDVTSGSGDNLSSPLSRLLAHCRDEFDNHHHHHHHHHHNNNNNDNNNNNNHYYSCNSYQNESSELFQCKCFTLAQILVLLTLAASLTDDRWIWSREELKMAKNLLVELILTHPQRDPLSMRLLNTIQPLLITHFTNFQHSQHSQHSQQQRQQQHSQQQQLMSHATPQLRLAVEDLVESWLDHLSHLLLLRRFFQDYR
jgi:hypothetical protein